MILNEVPILLRYGVWSKLEKARKSKLEAPAYYSTLRLLRSITEVTHRYQAAFRVIEVVEFLRNVSLYYTPITMVLLGGTVRLISICPSDNALLPSEL